MVKTEEEKVPSRLVEVLDGRQDARIDLAKDPLPRTPIPTALSD